MDGVERYAKLVHVYDGDTFRAAMIHNNRIKKLTFRPVGYDTPEMKPLKSMPNRETHIRLAKEARAHLIELCGGIDSYVFIKCHKFDKYGRVLATVYRTRYSKKSINQMMLDSGLANAYDGGTKKDFMHNASHDRSHGDVGSCVGDGGGNNAV
jgi:endonuclease YncB( thermonuclease family)